MEQTIKTLQRSNILSRDNKNSSVSISFARELIPWHMIIQELQAIENKALEIGNYDSITVNQDEGTIVAIFLTEKAYQKFYDWSVNFLMTK